MHFNESTIYMNNENIRTIDLGDFQHLSSIMDYIDDEIAIINSIEGLTYNNEDVRLGCFLMVFCIEGCIQMDINSQTYHLQPGDFLLGLPNTILSNTMLSLQHKIRLAVFSTGFVQRTIRMEKKVWDAAVQIHKKPVNPLEEDKYSSIFRLYEQLIISKISSEAHCYNKEVIHCLFSAVFCEMLGKLTLKQKSNFLMEQNGETKNIRPQAGSVLRSFMQKLSEDGGIHRSVTYYAEMLCYSPKHFSNLIKQASGKSPSELINESTVTNIK